tara:strand:- start:1262 stop:1537 length:276 start_codon:yes stop_codon:yes gene_type:complete
VISSFHFIHLHVASNDHQITSMSQTCGRPVEANFTLFSFNDVSGKALAVVAVVNVHPFKQMKSCLIDQTRADGHRAFIGQVGIGDGGTVDF